MGFRTVVVSTHSKLELSLNYLVFKTPDEVKRINIDEIQTLIIESTAVAITTSLLSELVRKKIKVIFCNEKKTPVSELVPYYGDSISFKRIKQQMSWTDEIKDLVWKEIIIEKIKNQARVLKDISEEDSNSLLEYSKDVVEGDLTNREGHAAKFYFNRVYGEGFTRNNNSDINKYLNYGYTLVLSQFSKAIVAKGYLTQLGIHNIGETNYFNLACDFMEPVRPFIDKRVKDLTNENFKEKLVEVLSETFVYDEQKQTLSNAISLYVSSLLNALALQDPSKINFIKEYE